MPAWCPLCAQPIAGDELFCRACGADLASPLAMLGNTFAATEVRTEPQLNYASFGQRLAAHFIDQAAVLAVAWFVGRPVGAMLGSFTFMSDTVPAQEMTFYIGALLVAALTSFVFEVYWTGSHLQGTPGKLALRLKVTDRFGKPIGIAHAFGRYFSKGLSGSVFCIGFLMQPFTEKKQALHDLLAGTLVINR